MSSMENPHPVLKKRSSSHNYLSLRLSSGDNAGAERLNATQGLTSGRFHRDLSKDNLLYEASAIYENSPHYEPLVPITRAQTPVLVCNEYLIPQEQTQMEDEIDEKPIKRRSWWTIILLVLLLLALVTILILSISLASLETSKTENPKKDTTITATTTTAATSATEFTAKSISFSTTVLLCKDTEDSCVTWETFCITNCRVRRACPKTCNKTCNTCKIPVNDCP